MKKDITLKNISNETNANSIVTLGEIIKNEETYNVPIIEVLLDGKCAGYLSPFRKYSFQVSMTAAGQWDMGSSPVVGLKNVLRATPAFIKHETGYMSNLRWESPDNEAQACLLKGLALQALVEYSSRENAVLKLGKHSFEEDCVNCTSKYYHDKLEKFIAVVVDYLKEGNCND